MESLRGCGDGILKTKIGFLRAECKKVNAPLPLIDAENGGVSISAYGCEKYISMLRCGQYGQVGLMVYGGIKKM